MTASWNCSATNNRPMPRRIFLIVTILLLGFAKAEAQNVVFDTVGNAVLSADTIVKEEKAIKKTAKAK